MTRVVQSRRRSGGSRRDKGEGYACACISKELGLPVEVYDDGSKPGMHDLEIYYPDGSLGAVEVTTCTHATNQALWNETAGVDWVEPDLRWGWIVRFERNCKLARKWRQRLAQLLRKLDAQGLKSTTGTRFQVELEAIGASEVMGCNDVEPGRIFLWPKMAYSAWTPQNADPVIEWFEEWILHSKRRDNLDKLARSGHPNRHLFLGFTGFSDAPGSVSAAMSSDDIALPTRPPNLPEQITELWLVGGWSFGRGLRWSVATGWKFFDKPTGKDANQGVFRS